MIQATVIKKSYDSLTFKPLPDQYATIQAADKDSLLALFFREYDNRYKYCNSVRYVLADPSMRQEYRVWFSDIRNYADNGGDMW
jgi:hypothetical protein